MQVGAGSQEPKKIILCFDGTGNSFSGSNADTNVVKLLSKLDRNHPDQYHYYQTGIGTLDFDEKSINKSWFGELRSSISQTVDQGVGTSFDAHVMAGYRFLMRYYESGAKIYIFGFSRGAFTAKFLSRMINTVGLLCKGNEEMVPFAYRLYQRYLAGDIKDRLVAQDVEVKTCDDDSVCETDGNSINGIAQEHVEHSRETQLAENEITAFSQTFCRNETIFKDGKPEEKNIKVFFLGLWDCVNSVAVLESKTPVPVPVAGTAEYVRHAVAVDERRVKFKPALLAQDINAVSGENIKEVWFPGGHGDVGGGWPSVADNPLDNHEKMTFFQRVKNFWTSRKAKKASQDIDSDRLQMSDVPLAWMISELELVAKEKPSAGVKWCKSLDKFKHHFKHRKGYALSGVIHDSLAFGVGTGFFKVLLWRFLEIYPFTTRWELIDKKWVNVRFPLNLGGTRDIPENAVMHQSLIWRLTNDDTYLPPNNHGGRDPPCLKNKGVIANFKSEDTIDPDHSTFVFDTSSSSTA